MLVGSRYRALAFSALVLAAILSQAAAADEKNAIYYLIPSRIDEFQTESQKAIEVVFGGLGYTVRSFDAEGQSDRQFAQFEEAIRRQPAAIILNAVDFVSIVPAIAKANQGKIPVMVYDRLIQGAPNQPKVAIAFSSVADGYGIGELAAIEAIRLLYERKGETAAAVDPSHSPMKRILHIPGDPRDDYSLEVQRGFEAKMRSTNGISITTKPAIDWEPRDAEKILRDELSQNSFFDLIFCHASHLIQPLLSLTKQPDTIFISANGAPNGLKNLKTGKQHREIEQPLYAQVYGLALGFQAIILQKGELPAGPCNLLGVAGKIENAEYGPILKLDGTVIRPEDLQTEAQAGHSYWGNFVPPQKSAQLIQCGQ